MTLNWAQAAVAVDRFVGLVDENLRQLRQQHALIRQLEDGNQIERMTTEKLKTDRLVNQLQVALQQVLEIRIKLDPAAHAQFDERIEPVRLRIQSTLTTIREKRPTKPPISSNPFKGDDNPNFFNDCFDSSAAQPGTDYPMQEQTQLYGNQQVDELRLRAEQARSEAEATKKLENDIEDLNQVMVDLAQLVHTQHEMVDTIEANVEHATIHVTQGHTNVQQALHYQNKARQKQLLILIFCCALLLIIGLTLYLWAR